MRDLACFQTFEYYTNQPAEALCRRVADLAPMREAKVFLTPGGGSDAVDTAGKLARADRRGGGGAAPRGVGSPGPPHHGAEPAVGPPGGGPPRPPGAPPPVART